MDQNLDIIEEVKSNETIGMGQISLPITDSPITDNASGNTVSDNKLEADVDATANTTANATANTNATATANTNVNANTDIASNNSVSNTINNNINNNVNTKLGSDNNFLSNNNFLNNNQINLIIKPPDLKITDEHIKLLIKNIYEVLGQHKLDQSNYLETAASVYHTAASMKDIPVRLRGDAIVNALQNVADQQNIDSELVKNIINNVPRIINVLDDTKHHFIQLKNKSCCVIV